MVRVTGGMEAAFFSTSAFFPLLLLVIGYDGDNTALMARKIFFSDI
jgi:hypothetical protein